jgi:hypothetical protein
VPTDLKGEFTAKVEFDAAPYKCTAHETKFTLKGGPPSAKNVLVHVDLTPPPLMARAG